MDRPIRYSKTAHLPVLCQDGSWQRAEVVLKNTTEEQAQKLRSLLNSRRLIPATSGNEYKVLDVYPPCNTKRVVLIGKWE